MQHPLAALVGPAGCGKSTLGALLASSLGAPFVDLDEVGGRYYAEVGWSLDRLRQRAVEVGRTVAEIEWEPARIHAVERAFEEHGGAVVALGAGHTSYEAPAHVGRVRSALRRPPHVVLPLPWPDDRDESLRVLRARSVVTAGTDRVYDGNDLLARWLDEPVVREAATVVVGTGREAPAVTAERLRRALRQGP
ncbi:shikimate kinase [Xylanimonas oleitrophica]|uniref:shikimate kinase n=1 Tax=Xylanimonas oleitrophica TaxID=2607479 RepID=UPI0015D076FB|nr:shikimate kinase [Xylanimonas oleitrophica]